MSDYKIPDPKVDPVKCLVLAYKTTKGIAYDNRSWDLIHFSRTAKAAKVLLEICGNVRVADSCLMEISQKFETENIGWTLETIVRHAHEWLSKKRGSVDGNTHRARFFKALAERDRSPDDNPLRQDGESILDTARSLKDPETGHPEDPHR